MSSSYSITVSWILQPIQRAFDNGAALLDFRLRNGERWRDAEGGIAVEEPVAHNALLLEYLHQAIEVLGLAKLQGE